MTVSNNRLPIIVLFTANAISLTGNVLTTVAIPWFVLQTTGSPAKTGVTGFFSILPVVLAGFLGGVLVDRLGYKRTSILSDLASGITVALVPLLHFTVGLEFWQLMVLVFLGAFLDAPGSTARYALVPELAELAGMPIERAASLTQIIERSSRLIGAPLAGVLIAVIGTANVLWLDAVSFFVSAGMISVFITTRSKPGEAERQNYYEDLVDGLRFLARDRLMLAIVIMVMITNFLDAAFGGVIQPVYVKQVYGSALDLGLLIAAGGGGAVVGALIFSAIGHRLPRHSTFVSMFVLVSLRFWIYALYPPLSITILAVFITGIGAGPLNPIIAAVEYERIPPGMRGRVFGTIQAGAWAAMPLGMLLGGVLTEQYGLQPILIGLGITYLASTLAMAVIPAMREMNRQQVVGSKQSSIALS
ncbi:MAG TPA: MFS transporter [Aestuariivirga sp.]|nr:MFS transporter [Aestuariivirga sp.]